MTEASADTSSRKYTCQCNRCIQQNSCHPMAFDSPSKMEMDRFWNQPGVYTVGIGVACDPNPFCHFCWFQLVSSR